MSIPFNVLKYNCKVQKLQGTIIPINLYESPYEATLEIDGLSYHIIFGHQINGWFLCIPNWKIGVEMAHPSDTFWNRESLCNSGVGKRSAYYISSTLCEISAYCDF